MRGYTESGASMVADNKTGQNWEKYKKEFADDEKEEKKIAPLTDEYDIDPAGNMRESILTGNQGHPSTQDLQLRSLCHCSQRPRKSDQGQADISQ